MKNPTKILFALSLSALLLNGCAHEETPASSSEAPVSTQESLPSESSETPGKTYTITWEQDDGEVLLIEKDVKEGTLPVWEGATPTRPTTQQYSYTFAGWSPEIVPAVADATYMATYTTTTQKYTITFANADGTALQQDQWEYGATPAYNGTTPTQASDEAYFYDFKGWDYEIARVCEDTTYTATYARHSLGLQFALTTNKKGYKVTKYSGSASSIEVGEVHNGLPVTEIGPSALANTKFTAILLPSSLTTISLDAFYNAALTSVTIPSSLTYLADESFRHCLALTSISVPTQNSLTYFGRSVFNECTAFVYHTEGGANYVGNSSNPAVVLVGPTSSSVTSCTMASGCSLIAASAFAYSKLASITTDDALKIICDQAFLYVDNLTSFHFPLRLSLIGSDNFQLCPALASFTVDKDNTDFSADSTQRAVFSKDQTQLLYYATNSGTTYTVPETVTTLGNNAFYNAKTLTSVTLPKNLSLIDENAFYLCTGLTAITIPEGTKQIGGAAFYGCSSLASLSLPSSITSLQQDSFGSTSLLLSATFAGTTAAWALLAAGTINGIASKNAPGFSKNFVITCNDGSLTWDGSAWN
jgi:hypothetical protein